MGRAITLNFPSPRSLITILDVKHFLLGVIYALNINYILSVPVGRHRPSCQRVPHSMNRLLPFFLLITPAYGFFSKQQNVNVSLPLSTENRTFR